MRDLPTGTITLLFTDIEGSTHLLQQLAACRREQRAVRPVVMQLSASFMAQARTTERSEGASEIGPGMVTE